MAQPELIRKDALTETAQTPGIVRREAFASGGVWVGVATTEPHVVSGWHHHGDHATCLYIKSGRFRLDSGPGGREAIEGGARRLREDSRPGWFIASPISRRRKDLRS